MFKFLSKIMSCGHCGTDAPHGNSSEEKEKCMACECPCEEHKEHTHGQEGGGHEEHHAEGEHHEEKPSGVCEKCSHSHKDDGNCDCGCA